MITRREIAALRGAWPLLAAHRFLLTALVALGVAASLVEGVGIGLLIPLLQGVGNPAASATGIRVLDWLVQRWHATSELLLLILAAVLAKALIAYLYTALVNRVRSRVQHELRVALYQRVLATPQLQLDLQPTGSLLNLLTAGPGYAAQAAVALAWLLISACTFVVFVGLLLVVSWQLTLAAALFLLALSRLARWTSQSMAAFGRGHLEAREEINQQVNESLIGMRTIRAFGREEYEGERLATVSRRLLRLETHQGWIAALAHPLTEGLAAITLLGVVYWALNAGFDMAQLITLTFLLYRLQPQVQNSNGNFAELLCLSATVESVRDMLATAPPADLAERAAAPPLRREILFEGVGFTYPGHQAAALEEIHCRIERGRITAIVGPSGAGKSTLVHLLLDLYTPTRGRILIDGTPLAGIDPHAWRERLALVSQDIHLFSGSVAENIAYGRLEATPEEIEDAARRAHADDFIRALPQGYATRVGDRGMRLSGGQRQRIAIARAILRDPDVLILDEATNALDSLSEAAIQESIDELRDGRALVVVAHRLSTIERADQVLVFDQGRLVEQGGYRELVERGGLLARLHHAQHRSATAIASNCS